MEKDKNKVQKGANLAEVQKKLMEQFESDIKPGLEKKYKLEICGQSDGKGFLYWCKGHEYKGRPAKVLKIYESGRVEVYDEIPELSKDKKLESLLKKYNTLMKESIERYIDKRIKEELKKVRLKESSGDPVLDELVSVMEKNKGGLFSLEDPLKAAGFVCKWHDYPQGMYLTVTKRGRGSKEYAIGSKNMFTLSDGDVVVGELAVGAL